MPIDKGRYGTGPYYPDTHDSYFDYLSDDNAESFYGWHWDDPPVKTQIIYRDREVPAAPAPAPSPKPEFKPNTPDQSEQINKFTERSTAYEDNLPNTGTEIFGERNSYYYGNDDDVTTQASAQDFNTNLFGDRNQEDLEPFKSSDINAESERKASLFNNQYKLNLLKNYRSSSDRSSAQYIRR